MGDEGVRFDLGGVDLPAPVPLAHRDAIRLGPLTVEPALCRVSAGDDGRSGGRTERLEPLMMQVLLALTTARGATLSRDDLIAACWDGRIVSDDAINRVVSRLRGVLGRLSEGQVRLEAVPKVGYRLVVADGEAGAPVRKDDTAQAPDHSGWRRVRFAGLGAAALAVASAALWAFALPRDAASATTTISVEPVMNGARDREAERFASDLTSDFARLAGAMGEVSVIEAGASQRSGRSDYVMRASIERQGERLTAQARLVSSSDGAVLWSRAFTDETGSIAALREQIAISVAEVMRCGLARSAAILSDDPASARLFFGMCEALGDGDWTKAEVLAGKIVARRPEVSTGWACLAMATIAAASHDPNSSAASVAAESNKARGFALKAIRLDAASAYGYNALAMVEAETGNTSRALAVYERGLGIDPDYPHLHKGYGIALFNAGYAKAGVAPALRAMALDPTSQLIYDVAVRRLLATGRVAEALAIQARAERLWPNHPEGKARRLRHMINYGDPATALAMLDRLARETGREPELPPLARAWLGWRIDPANLDLASLDRESETAFRESPTQAWFIASAMTRMGETDRAFAWLARAPVTEAQNQWSILFWPEAAPLRRDPRFFKAMAELGLVDLWRARGKWPDFCSEPGLRYDCRTEAARLAKATTA